MHLTPTCGVSVSWKSLMVGFLVSRGGGDWRKSWDHRFLLVERKVYVSAPPITLHLELTQACSIPRGRPFCKSRTSQSSQKQGLGWGHPLHSWLLARWVRGICNCKRWNLGLVFSSKCLNKQARLLTEKHFHKKMVLARVIGKPRLTRIWSLESWVCTCIIPCCFDEETFATEELEGGQDEC